MASWQGDLFSARGFPAEGDGTRIEKDPAVDWNMLGEERLIADLANANMADGLAIVAEIGRRKASAAIPALERLCQRFAGFGLNRIVPEQAAVLDALVSIGERTAAQAVARLISRGVLQGPGLIKAVRAAADLGSSLPSGTLFPLLRHDCTEMRAAACRCIDGRSPPAVAQAVVELLDDLHPDVREAAACALGRMGRKGARELLVLLLRHKPSAEVVGAIPPIADEECIVLLGRLAKEDRGLRPAILDALDAIDHPRADMLAAALRCEEQPSAPPPAAKLCGREHKGR